MELSKEAHFASSLIYITEKSSILIDNLETDTVYYWRVNGSSARFFRTAGDCPRFIRIEGALNVRDLGGNKIKQGILHRGSAIDGPFVLTENGKNAFRNELKIKTEIVQRKESNPEKTDANVDGVKWLYMPYRPYMEAFQKQILLFSVIAETDQKRRLTGKAAW